MAFLILRLVMVAILSVGTASQVFAGLYRYSPHLKREVFYVVFGNWPIYKPWALAVWLYRWPVLNAYAWGSIGVAVALMLIGATVAILQRDKAARLESHGSATWATDKELKRAGL